MKRSRKVALVTMGIAAVTLTACGDGGGVVEANRYDSVDACASDGKFDRKTCERAWYDAQATYDEAYPTYASQADCEAAAGATACERDRPMSRQSSWRPLMTGFLLGSMVQPQAVVASTTARSGFATATGAEVRGSGTAASIDRSAAARPTASAVRTAATTSRGGFGTTAASVSAHGGGTAHAGG